MANALRPRPLHRQYLTYDGRLTHGGVEPVSPEELIRLLIEPKDVSVEELSAWKVEHKRRCTTAWLKAQCLFYNLAGRPSSYKDELLRHSRKSLQRLSQEGRRPDPKAYHYSCFSLPPAQEKAMADAWNASCAAFEPTLKDRHHYEAFSKLDDLEDKLRLDPYLFMDTYFLDRNKTRQTLVFHKTDLNYKHLKDAVATVTNLHAKMVGRGKAKKLRIGWDIDDVLYPDARSRPVSAGSSPPPPTPAVQAEIAKAKKRVARLAAHNNYILREPSWSVLGPLEGHYHMEISGTGWNDKLYKPDGANMWMDIRASTITSGVYEATFDFATALKGMLLISVDMDLIRAHSRIMDTMDWEVDFDSPDKDPLLPYEERLPSEEPEVKEDPRRQAFLDGWMYAMNRKRTRDDDLEDAYSRIKRPRPSWDEDKKPQPTKYRVLCRGSLKVPEWSEDMLDEYANQWEGWMTFKDDGKLNEFKLELMAGNTFKGVPCIAMGSSTIQGYRESDYPKHDAAVPEHEYDEDDRFLDDCRVELGGKSRKRKTDWGMLREHNPKFELFKTRDRPEIAH